MKIFFSLFSLGVIAGYVCWCIFKPLPVVSATLNSTLFLPTAIPSQITWPAAGQSAVGVLGTNIMLTHSAQTKEPTASTAKMLTALMVLKAKPLGLNQPGPEITLGPNDVALYNSYYAKNGSVVQVVDGEKISEYQMLEAMLMPSANNIADSLATWAYGSLPNYSQAANNYAKTLGLSSTQIGTDASGFSPTNVSSAADLVKIGEALMNNPVLAQIVNQKQASGIPVVNNIKNVNYLLGTNNIIGIKTGNNDQVGGVYVSASSVTLNGSSCILVTANSGDATLGQAVTGSLPMITSAQANLKIVRPLLKDTVVGYYKLPWNNQSLPIKTDQNLSGIGWGGDSISPAINSLEKLPKPTRVKSAVGSIKISGNGVVKTNQSNLYINGFEAPSLLWRLEHPA